MNKTVIIKYPVRVPNTSITMDTIGYTNYVCINNDCRYVFIAEVDSKSEEINNYIDYCTILETRKGYHMICPITFDKFEDYIEYLRYFPFIDHIWWMRQYQYWLYHKQPGNVLRIGRKYLDGYDIKIKSLRLRKYDPPHYKALLKHIITLYIYAKLIEIRKVVES